MNTTTEASTEARPTTIGTTAFIRDDARIDVQRHGTAPEYIAVHVTEADYWERLTLYLTEAQALALYHRLGDALVAATAVAE